MPSGKAFEMDRERKKCAEMLALEGRFDDDGNFIGMNKGEIAKYFDIHYQTLRNWENRPEFAQEVDRIKMTTGLAKKAERVNMARKVAEKSLKAIMDKLDNEAELKMSSLEFLLAEGRRWLDLLRHEMEGDGGKGASNVIQIQNNTFSLDELGDRFKQRTQEAGSRIEKHQNPFEDLINNGDKFVDETDKILMNAEEDEEE